MVSGEEEICEVDMGLAINWTTVIASALTAVIVSGFTLVANRYLTRILDRIEKEVGKNGKNGSGKPKTP